MKATLALTLANAMLVASNPLQQRAYVTQVDVKTVTQYVYPDGSPATHIGPQPTPEAKPEEQKAPAPSSDKPSEAPSSSDGSSSSEQPASSSGGGEQPANGDAVPENGAGDTGDGNGANGEDVGTVYEASMNAHNAHRANHTCGQVEWDDRLYKLAQQLADTCVYDHDVNMDGGGYGQNIAMNAQTNYQLTDGQAITRAITRQWYNNEFELYPAWGLEPDQSTLDDWGHLSQIVWKDTKKIGCAVAKCPSGKLNPGMEGYFAVCNYDPPGNVPGEFPTNVLAPLKGAKVLPG